MWALMWALGAAGGRVGRGSKVALKRPHLVPTSKNMSQQRRA